MATKYNDLDELRRKKSMLQRELDELEDLLKFDNPKESLSALTNGLTDRYLAEVPSTTGGTKTVLSLRGENVKNSVMDNGIRLGIATLVGNYAKKSIRHHSWKKKLIGFALIYIAPIVLRKISDAIAEKQQRRLEVQASAGAKNELI
ncbi:MAG: hypothetical protein EAS48_05525 [Chryseobacterium sp.]|nr:MAG: hypothetical protein EAS48_05525 [Chryseobacterium sp.]